MEDNKAQNGNIPYVANGVGQPIPAQAPTPLFADVARPTPPAPIQQPTPSVVNTPVPTGNAAPPGNLAPLPPAPPPTPSGLTPAGVGNVPKPPKKPRNWRKLLVRSGIVTLILLLIGSGVLLFDAFRNQSQNNQVNSAIANTTIPLSEFANSGSLSLLGAQSLTVNGQLRANESFVLAPNSQPTNSEKGQLYYDKTANVLAYYNGSQFVQLNGSSGVQTFQGQTGNVTLVGGNGVTITGTTINNSGVTSLGDQTGAITLGGGLAVNGNTLQNTGITSAVAGSNNVIVNTDANGQLTISTTAAGTGTVQSPGGTAGSIALFTGNQTIDNSIITQMGLTVTITGDLSVVTGGLTLSNALTISNGGTGANSLAANGVIVGNGTSALSSVTAASAGLCLLSTAGQPTFGACPSGSGVSSLNGLTGALSIANASGSGTTITIDDASTSAKGIASFNSTNFSASGGVINTIQNINSGASPTFANATLQGGSITLGTTSQAGSLVVSDGSSNTGTLQVAALGQNTVYTLPDPGGATATICLTTGNCAGTGSGVTTGGGTTNRLAKFSGSQAIANSTITDDGTNVTTSVNMIVQGGNVTLGVASSQTGSITFQHSGSAFTGTLSQGALTGSRTYTLPDQNGTICLSSGNCSGTGSSNTLQAAYDAGNVLTTSDARNIAITLANTTTDSNFSVTIADGSTSYSSFTRANGAGTTDPSQIILVDNLDTDRAVAAGIKVQAAAGGITTGLDVSDPEIVDALNAGANNIVGTTGNLTFTNFTVTGSTGTITSGGNLNLNNSGQFQINGSQITSAALANDSDLAKLSASQTFVGNTNSFKNGTNSSNGFNVQNASGTRVLTVDTAAGALVLGVSNTLGGTLVFNDVASAFTSTISTTTLSANRTLTIPDTSGVICTDSGNCAGAGATLQTAYNFSAGGTTPKIKVNSTLLGVDIQDADTTIAANLFNIRASNSSGLGSVMFGVSSTGQVTLQNASNSTTAFRVLTSGGTTVFTADTQNGQLLLGQSGTLTGAMVFRNATNSNAITLTSAVATGAQTITLPDATGTVCLSVGNCSGAGSSNTLQAAYDAGNTILTSSGRDVAINLADSTTDGNFTITTATNATGFTTFTRANGAGTADPTQLVLISNQDTDRAQPVGLAFSGTITSDIYRSAGTLTLQTGTNGIALNTPSGQSVTLSMGTNLTLQGVAYISNAQSQTGGEAFGANATTSGNAVAVGNGATAFNSGVAVGHSATTTSTSAVAVGNGATANFLAIAVGDGSDAAQQSVALGTGAITSAHDSVAIGQGANVGHQYSIAIGEGASSTTGSQLVIGSNAAPIAQAVIGNGVTNATPVGFTLQATGGSGSNVAGANINIAGGVGTGTGNGGSINFRIAAPGSTGSSANSLTTVATLSGTDGTALFKNAANSLTGFQVQDASSNAVFTVDTTNAKVALGKAGTSTGTIVFNGGGASNTNTITLVGQASPGGNRTITLPDASGTICLQTSTSCGFATGSGNAFVQGGNSFGAIANFGTTDNFGINIRTNNNIVSSISNTGAVVFQNSSNSTAAFDIQNAAGNTLFKADTTNSRVGINLGASNTPASTLEVNGTLRISGTATESFITPQGISIPTKINVPLFDPGSFGQIMAMGLPSSAQPTARVLTLLDGRTVAHQPTLAVLSPNESGIAGINWNGSNTQANFQTMDLTTSGGNTSQASFQSGSVAGGNGSSGDVYLQSGAIADGSGGFTSGAVSIQSGNATGTTANSGNIAIDVGTATGTTGQIYIGGTNTTAIHIGHTGGTNNTTNTIRGLTTFTPNTDATGDLVVTDANGTQLFAVGGSGGVQQTQLGFNGTFTGRLQFNGGGASNTNSITLVGQAAPGGNRTITLPDATGTVCLDSGNCSGAGAYILNQSASDQTASLRISGTARANTSVLTPTLDTATATTLNIGASGTPTTTAINLNQNTTIANNKTLTVLGTALIQPASNNSSALTVKDSSNNVVLNVDTTNQRVGVGGVASASKFEVQGGDAAIYNSGANPRLILGDNTTAGNNGFIQWDSTNKYIRIETTGTNGLKINDNFVAIGNITPDQPLKVANGSTLLAQVNTTGQALFRTSTNSTAAMQVQNTGGTDTIFDVDTTNRRVGINTNAPTATLTVVQNTSTPGTVSNSASSATVTGSSTTFTSTFSAGDTFTITSSGNLCTVSVITSDTSLTCTATLASSSSGSAYTFTAQTRLAVTDNGHTNVNGTLNLTNTSAGHQFSVGVNALDGQLKLASNVIGKPAQGPATDNNGSFIMATKYNSGTGGTINSLSVNLRSIDGTGGHFKVALYADNSGVPGSRISSATAPSTMGVVGWNNASLGGTYTLTPNTDYWLAFTTEGGNTAFSTHSSGSGSTKYQSGFTWGTNFPSTFTVNASSTDNISIYGAYMTVNVNQSTNVGGLSVGDNNNVTVTPLWDADSAFVVQTTGGTSILDVDTRNQYVGVSKLLANTSYTSASIAAGGNGSTSAGYFEGGGSATVPVVLIKGGTSPTSTANLLTVTNASDNKLVTIDRVGLTTFQNSSGVAALTVDAPNAKVTVGPAAGNTTGTILVLGNKTNAGDPTGTAGAMYYNSSTNTFRCYENGGWTDCLSRHKIVLASDVVDSSGTCTSTNLTGLSFNVTSGNTYHFEANIGYTSADTGTGSEWSVTAPASTFLGFVTHTLGASATAEDVAYNNTSDAGTCSNASPNTSGIIAKIDGMVTPSANGTLQVRFATEVAGSAITAKAGSTLEWW